MGKRRRSVESTNNERKIIKLGRIQHEKISEDLSWKWKVDDRNIVDFDGFVSGGELTDAIRQISKRSLEADHPTVVSEPESQPGVVPKQYFVTQDLFLEKINYFAYWIYEPMPLNVGPQGKRSFLKIRVREFYDSILDFEFEHGPLAGRKDVEKYPDEIMNWIDENFVELVAKYSVTKTTDKFDLSCPEWLSRFLEKLGLLQVAH